MSEGKREIPPLGTREHEAAMNTGEKIKVALTLAEAVALSQVIDRDHWAEFPEVMSAFAVIESGRFEFYPGDLDALLDVSNPDDWSGEPDEDAMVSACLRLRQAYADYLGWDVARVNRTLGWSR